MKSRGDCGRSRFHCHESTIGFVNGFIGLVSVSHVLEHFADHLRRVQVELGTIQKLWKKLNYRNFAADEEFYDIGSQGVPVLVQKSVHVVPNLTGVMLDRELRRTHSRPGVQFAQCVVVMAFFEKRQIRGFWEIALVVQKMQNPNGFLRYQVYDWQIVLQLKNECPNVSKKELQKFSNGLITV